MVPSFAILVLPAPARRCERPADEQPTPSPSPPRLTIRARTASRWRRTTPRLHAIHYAFGALLLHYRDRRSDVYVSADLLIYYEEGNPRVSVAPDTFVVFGVEDHKRMNYKVWEEGKGPDFVLEVASPNTWRGGRGERSPASTRVWG